MTAPRMPPSNERHWISSQFDAKPCTSAAWISRAQGHVDWIILDAAPVLESYADTAPLAPLATDVLLVHNRHRADANCVRAALAMLQPMMSASALRGIVHNAA